MKKRHIFFYKLFRYLVIVFLKLRFNYRYRIAKDLPENYIVISNHTTDYDMLFVASSFKRQMYFVGSEHVARWGLFSKFLKYAFDPIIRRKGASALSAVLEILKKTKKGANVCLFAEGVRSWDGASSPVPKSTADLIKTSKCALVTYKIKGGYFSSPMWAGASVRRGKISGEVVRVLTKEQIAELSSDEIYEIIVGDIQENAYETQSLSPSQYKGNQLAQGLEKLLFLCPECNNYTEFVTYGNTVTCPSCAHSFDYDTFGYLNGSPFKTLKEFSDWQKERLSADAVNNLSFSVNEATLSSIKNHEETPITKGTLSVGRDALTLGECTFPIEEISELSMHGQSSIVFSHRKDYYEIIVPRKANALKFMLLFNTYKNITMKAEV